MIRKRTTLVESLEGKQISTICKGTSGLPIYSVHTIVQYAFGKNNKDGVWVLYRGRYVFVPNEEFVFYPLKERQRPPIIRKRTVHEVIPWTFYHYKSHPKITRTRTITPVVRTRTILPTRKKTK